MHYSSLSFSQPSTQSNVLMVSSRRSNLFLILLVVDCSSLTDPANGSVTHTAGKTFRQTATYSCNTGYTLVGDSSRTCQATGNSSGSAPSCEGVLLKTNLIFIICAFSQQSCTCIWASYIVSWFGDLIAKQLSVRLLILPCLSYVGGVGYRFTNWTLY